MIETASKSESTITRTTIDRLPIVVAALLVALFLPVVGDVGTLWLHETEAGHCLFIIPIAIALLRMRRGELAQARREPKPYGLFIMAAGVVVEVAAYLMRIHPLEVWSFIPIVSGAVLLLYGPDVFRIARFPIFMILLLMPLSSPIAKPLGTWIRTVSTIGATNIVDWLGYPVIRTGNVIQIPGMTVEVATVCSGFNKLAVLLTTALLYGYLFSIGYVRRFLLVAATVPIAVVANCIRIAIVMLVAYYGGEPGFHFAHTYSEVLVILASFALFVAVGNLMGCKTLRFTTESPSS